MAIGKNDPALRAARDASRATDRAIQRAVADSRFPRLSDPTLFSTPRIRPEQVEVARAFGDPSYTKGSSTARAVAASIAFSAWFTAGNPPLRGGHAAAGRTERRDSTALSELFAGAWLDVSEPYAQRRGAMSSSASGQTGAAALPEAAQGLANPAQGPRGR